MKWRDRISILSRKRRQKSSLQPGNALHDLPAELARAGQSGHSSRSTSGPSVASTLAQVRPVIGPDHKSYYILLRGAGDSFTCIQPAKEVLNSLDEVMKNVMTSVELEKLPELPNHARNIVNRAETGDLSDLPTHARNVINCVKSGNLSDLPAHAKNVINSVQSGKTLDTRAHAKNAVGIEHSRKMIALPTHARGVNNEHYVKLLDLPTHAKNVVSSEHSEKLSNLSTNTKNVASPGSEPSQKLCELSKKTKHGGYGQTKTCSSEPIQRHGESKRKNGVQSSPLLLLNRSGKHKPGSIKLSNVCDDKESEVFDSDSAMENAILNRLLLNLSSEPINQSIRTSSLIYPLVQNKFTISSTKNTSKVQDSCLLVSSVEYDTESESLAMTSIESEPIPDTCSLYETIPTKKKDCLRNYDIWETIDRKSKTTHLAQDSFINSDVQEIAQFEECLASSLEHMESPPPQTEIHLLAREGTVLTEEQITAQVKSLIESAQLIVRENDQIVVMRVSAEEALVRIVSREEEVREAEMREREARETLQQANLFPPPKQFSPEHVFVKKDVCVSEELCEVSSLVQEDPCFQLDSLGTDSDTSRDLSSLFSTYTRLKQETCERREVAGTNEDLQFKRREESEYVQNQSQGQQYQEAEEIQYQTEAAGETVHFDAEGAFKFDEIERTETSLLSEVEEIVVFQREDGALVNQDGTPVSSELQYLIASSQQASSPPLDHTSFLLPPGPLVHPSLDINCSL